MRPSGVREMTVEWLDKVVPKRVLQRAFVSAVPADVRGKKYHCPAIYISVEPSCVNALGQ